MNDSQTKRTRADQLFVFGGFVRMRRGKLDWLRRRIGHCGDATRAPLQPAYCSVPGGWYAQPSGQLLLQEQFKAINPRGSGGQRPPSVTHKFCYRATKTWCCCGQMNDLCSAIALCVVTDCVTTWSHRIDKPLSVFGSCSRSSGKPAIVHLRKPTQRASASSIRCICSPVSTARLRSSFASGNVISCWRSNTPG